MPVFVDDVGVPAESVEEEWSHLVLTNCDAGRECAVIRVEDERGFRPGVAAEVFSE